MGFKTTVLPMLNHQPVRGSPGISSMIFFTSSIAWNDAMASMEWVISHVPMFHITQP